MRKYMLTLPDGSTVSSGVAGQDAICSLRLSRSCCDDTELAFGACCSAMVEAELFYYGQIPIKQADCLLLHAWEGDTLTPLGVFYAQEPSVTGPNRMTFTAYDAISLLDRDLTDWLAGLDGWPYGAYALGQMVCDQCGVTLESTQPPNADYPVAAFSAQVTGRRLMQWLGQIMGSFLTANARGNALWGWYRHNDRMQVGPTDAIVQEALPAQLENGVLTLPETEKTLKNGALSLPMLIGAYENGALALYANAGTRYHYRMDSLRAGSYTVAPVERVCIRKNAEDVGICWPKEASGNTYVLQGNPMLTQGELQAVCKELFARLQGLSYVPCTVTVPQGSLIAVGDLIKVTEQGGREFLTAVTRLREENGCVYLESTGSASRSGPTAANSFTQTAVSGRLLGLSMDVNGLRLENAENQHKLASLELTVDGVDARVRTQEGNTELLTQLRQESHGLQLQVQRLCDDGVSRVQTQTGYTFDAQGLRIQKDGQSMENLLDNTGMYVCRDGEQILRANHLGVSAVDVQVRNYLILGNHSRLEDYATADDPSRTACFYL